MPTTSTGPKTVEHPNLTAALAAFQATVPSIKKGNTAKVPTKAGGSYSYSYADLADVTEVVLPLLAVQGLAFTTNPTFIDGHFVLVFELRFQGGDGTEKISGIYPLPMNALPQEIGSAITYARRYALCAVTGVAPGGDDDDAAAAQSAPVTKRAKAPANFPKLVADATTVEELLAIHSHAQEEGWLDSDTIAALGTRKQEIMADIADIKAKLSGD